MNSPLRDYQADAAAQGFHTLTEFGGYYVQHPPGAGKCLTTIATARLLGVHRVAVVCPPVALGVWPREMAKWWPGFQKHVEMRCVSYDSLYDPMPAEGKRRVLGRNRLAELCDWSPELLVLDEAHYVKDVSAKRTRAIFQLARFSIYKLLLSGTPNHNDLDLYAQYKIMGVDEDLFNRTFTDYKQLIYQCHPTLGYPKKLKSGAWAYKPGAKDAIYGATVSYTHVIDEAQMELPEPVFSVIPHALNDKEAKAYNDMESVLRTTLPDGSEAEAEIVLTKLLRLTQIAAGHVRNTNGDDIDVGDSRERTVWDLLGERSDRKVVVACRFRRDISRVASRLRGAGRPFAIISGATKPAFRTQYEEWFQSDKHTNGVIILQYQAGGSAITLHAAHTLILYTLDLSVIRYRQMIGRIWRLGQKGICEILTPVAEGTQDETALAGLQAGDDNRLAKLLLDRLRGR